LQTNNDHQKQKSIVLDCTDVQGVQNNTANAFGEFYGVFEETYSNLDVYTGIENSQNQYGSLLVDEDAIIENSESVSPGLYSVFKQVEDGYSIVVLGYGLSGSGKTYTILGTNNTPGLLHYGLANLKNTQSIKLKYLFEQYIGRINLAVTTITGKIHNLIGEIPQMRDKSVDERAEFAEALAPLDINLANIRMKDLYALTETIESYRKDKKRIKKTPNNPVSSRSHLYLVFEVTFESGTTGYVTLVDTAGRESPVDIFNTYVEPNKTSMVSLMTLNNAESIVEKAKREDLDPTYTPSHILSVLISGFYINETINHLIYFFNHKNYRKTKIVSFTNAENYTVNKYFVKPYEEEFSINTAKNCLTIPIMKFLDNLSKRNNTELKPTKFIMMCMVRQEERYCDQIFETLEFAKSISST